MPSLKRLIDYGYSGPPGHPGVPGLTQAEIKEIERKKLIEERKKKIAKIDEIKKSN